jgi:hypothetical protein
VIEQVGDQKRLVLRKVAVVKDQQELATFLKALDRVRNDRREIPQVAFADIVDEGAALLVNRGDASTSGKHERPLRLLVPVPPGFRRMLTPANSVATGSSRTVTSRAQPPVKSRLRAVANENLRLGIVPESV